MDIAIKTGGLTVISDIKNVFSIFRWLFFPGGVKMVQKFRKNFEPFVRPLNILGSP